jgi:hypothetical protein
LTIVHGGNSSHSEFVYLGHVEKRLSVDEHIVLSKSWRGGQRRSGMASDFEHVTALGIPRKIEYANAVGAVVHFSTVHQNLSFARSYRPNDHDFMLFSTAIRSCSTLFNRFQIGKSKAPML